MDRQEKCPYDKTDTSLESDSSNSESPPSSKEKRSKISIFNLRKTRALHFNTKKGKKVQVQEASGSCAPVKKSPKWSIKFNCSGKKESKSASTSQEKQQCCTCVKIREESSSPILNENPTMVTEEPTPEAPVPDTIDNVDNVMPVVVEEANADVPRPNLEMPPVQVEQAEGIRGIYGISMNGSVSSVLVSAPFADGPLRQILHVDCDEAAILARAREIEQGVEPPANFRPVKRLQVLCSDSESESSGKSSVPPRRLQLVCPSDLNVESLKALFQNHVQLRSCPLDSITGCHTQIDFIHCLVPDLLNITNCSFYWGKMDRYEAERLLEGKQEGTFLLRDSAQEEFLFSVSFRKYGRSLHARIEQWNHRFSFDSHDPGVFTSDTVCGLIEHYKDPSSCMFFEPMLTRPLHRNFTFSLQHLARAVIVNRLTYDNINHLQLPKTLKTYLKEYHYRQKVRVERFDDDMQWLELRNVPP